MKLRLPNFSRPSAKACFFGFPLVLMTFCEWISDSPFGILKIFFHDPRVGVFSYLWILSIQTVAFAAFGRHSFAILSFAFGTVAYVNAQKIATLGEPLYPTDVFVHVSALGNLAGFSGTFQSAEIYVLTAGAALIGTGGYLLSDGISPTFRKRALAFFGIGAAQFLIATGAFGALSGIQAVAGLSPEDYSWRQVENYQKNGLVGGLFTNLGNIAIRQPEGYSKETVARIRGSVLKPEASPSPFRISGTEGKKPNVIVILSESFWDVTQLDGVKIEPNPIANFESVGQEIGTGRMISPMFGGKTALVEFEILTGNSKAYLPKGSVPYQQNHREPNPSIPWEFKKNGYETVAVHTYDRSFFNRARAYPILGFDRFIGKEDIPDPKYKGPFVSDETFTDEILRQLKDAKRTKPLFVFGISMENHFSYEGHKFDGFDVSVSGSGLTDDDIRTVRNYAQGIYDADRELGRLVAELRNFDEPTYLLFFGDHLGILGNDFGVYERSLFVSSADESEWSEKERLAMYSPPFLVWNNFSNFAANPNSPTNPREKRDFKHVRAPFLGNLLLDALWAENKDPHFDFLSAAEPCFKKTSAELELSIENPRCSDAMRNYSILQYFSLFDKTDR